MSGASVPQVGCRVETGTPYAKITPPCEAEDAHKDPGVTYFVKETVASSHRWPNTT